MSQNGNTTTSFTAPNYIGDVNTLVQWINENLERFSDKDWHYSRIRLTPVPVDALECPYLLACELIDMENRRAERELKDVQNEITWGDHHSNELGILEIISLRVNKALLATVGRNFYLQGAPPRRCHPVIRVVKRQDLLAAHVPMAIWYEVREVSGEDFENR